MISVVFIINILEPRDRGWVQFNLMQIKLCSLIDTINLP